MARIEKFVCRTVDKSRAPWRNGVRPQKSHLIISVEGKNATRLTCFDKIMAEGVEHQGAVVLAPGIATNGWFFGLGANGGLYTEDSFASFLAQIGYIVYVYHPSYSEKAINNHFRPCLKLGSSSAMPKYQMPAELSFEDLTVDVPIIIETVCEDARMDAVAWVGFSLGGMLILAYLAGAQTEKVNKVVVIGSPVIFNTFAERALDKIARSQKTEAALLLFAANLGMASPLLARLPDKALGLPSLGWPAMEMSNLSEKERKVFLADIIESIPPGLARSFLRFVREGFSPPGGISFIEQLARRQTQVLFSCIYAANDGLVSLENGYQIAEALSAPLFMLPGSHNNLVTGSKRDQTAMIVGNFLCPERRKTNTLSP
ncbi:MAG: alpha/beta fold hydrolase [Candidatus Margulisiibacteriota bacterium]